MWVVLLALVAASAVAVAQEPGETPEEEKPRSSLEERMQKRLVWILEIRRLTT